MDIYTKPGSKIIFDQPNNGVAYDRDIAAKHLKVGNEYTVAGIDIGNWSSTVYLEEIPNIGFNTVQFSNMPELITYSNVITTKWMRGSYRIRVRFSGRNWRHYIGSGMDSKNAMDMHLEAVEHCLKHRKLDDWKIAGVVDHGDGGFHFLIK